MSVMRIKDTNGNWQEVAALTGIQGPEGPAGPAGDTKVFVVNVTDLKKADATAQEILDAVADGCVCILRDLALDHTYTYMGRAINSTTNKEEPFFVAPLTQQGTRYLYASIYVGDDGTVTAKGSFVTTPSPFPLKLTGAVEAEFDGSKGVTVEIPEGGSSLRVDCVPSEDMSTFTADKTYDEIMDALTDDRMVYAVLHGVGVYIPLVGASDEAVMFSLTVGEGEGMGVVSLTMVNDGTNTITLTPIAGGGSMIIDFTTSDGENWTTSTSFDDAYNALVAGKMVYARLAEGLILWVRNYDSNSIAFIAHLLAEDNFAEIQLNFSIANEGTTIITPIGGGGDGKLLVVTATVENGVVTSSHSAAQIGNAYDTGMTPVFSTGKHLYYFTGYSSDNDSCRFAYYDFSLTGIRITGAYKQGVEIKGTTVTLTEDTLVIGHRYVQPDWGDAEDPVVLAKATYTIDAEGGMAFIPSAFNLLAGAKYTVNYNGLKFECEAVNLNGAIVLGNVPLLTEEAPRNGFPFVVMRIPDEDAVTEGVYGVIVPADQAGTVTLSIDKPPHKIPGEYVQNNTVMQVHFYKSDDGVGYTDKTFLDIAACIKGGGFAVLMWDVYGHGGASIPMYVSEFVCATEPSTESVGGYIVFLEHSKSDERSVTINADGTINMVGF